MARRQPPPGFIPPWQDAPTLCAHISVSERTLDAWVHQGLLPPPRPRGGKRLWKWTEVEAYLEGRAEGVSASPDADAERIKNATREAASR
jgi:excisionase family DNA binding protein